MKQIRYTAYGDSHIGKIRDENQDDYLVDNEKHVFAVADGMGGHVGGRECAQECIEWIQRRSPFARRDVYPSRGNAEILATMMGEAMRQKHGQMEPYDRDNPRQTPGSTLTTCKLVGKFVSLAHVGDSRLYALNSPEAPHVRQLSQDHSRYGRLYSSMGAGPADRFEVQTTSFVAEPGDGFLLCSDGLTNHVDNQGIGACWKASSGNVLLFCKYLISAALDLGGTDNITCVAFRIDPPGDQYGKETRAAGSRLVDSA